MQLPLSIPSGVVYEVLAAAVVSQGGRCSQHKYVTTYCWSSLTATDSPSLFANQILLWIVVRRLLVRYLCIISVFFWRRGLHVHRLSPLESPLVC